MNEQIDPNRGVPRYLFPERQSRSRPYIPAPMLHIIVAVLGCLVGLASFYLLRKVGL